MKIQKPKSFKKCGYIGVIVSTLLIMSFVVAGCTQTSSGTPAQGTVSPTTVTPTPQETAVALPGAYVGGHFQSNMTPFEAAAQNLGVSESNLVNAMIPPPQSHAINYTYSAAQLSAETGTTITSAQLMAALGIQSSATTSGVWKNGQNVQPITPTATAKTT
jgi:hypothetical protein